ncbi:hypothetical protein [Steroidobacter cummioxidans]|uniref:hypothetical protein n=1 Tax=Steroidobacter cummioxidans TaxID=1803913 RepID=UPI001F4E8AFB|nr:hypothetical protein [Steroidobacter cummioxidans]
MCARLRGAVVPAAASVKLCDERQEAIVRRVDVAGEFSDLVGEGACFFDTREAGGLIVGE